MTEYEDKPAKRRQDICATAKPLRNSRLYRSEWGWQRGQEKGPLLQSHAQGGPSYQGMPLRAVCKRSY
jgi:hypothetical protein